MHLREFRMADYEAVLVVWQAAGLHLSPTDEPAAIRHKLERDPDLFLLAVEEGVVVGTVLGAYDARRGALRSRRAECESEGY